MKIINMLTNKHIGNLKVEFIWDISLLSFEQTDKGDVWMVDLGLEPSL